LGEKEAKIELSQWIKKESGNCYYIDRNWKLIEHMLIFLHEVNPGIEYKMNVEHEKYKAFEREMELFGFGKAAKRENMEEINSQLFVDTLRGDYCWKSPEHIKV